MARSQVLIDGLNFPEGPRWHGGYLWFSDIHGHKVLRASLTGKVDVVASVDDRVSGLGFLPDGTLIVVSLLDRKLLAVDTASGAVRVHADMSGLSGSFTNDMVIDAAGRAYVGSRNGGAPASASDSLILVTADGRARVVAEGMVSPNGSVVTHDGQYLIVAETAVGRLTKFRIAADGSLTDKTVLASIPGHHIDGLCMDSGGAFWGGGGHAGALRISPRGQLLDVISVPGRMVLACVLGGGHEEKLYLATTSPRLLENLSYVGMDRRLDAKVDSGGRIEVLDVSRHALI
jgi:sugar lactone lactonase YvrE